MRVSALVLIIGLALCGCDHIHGVRRVVSIAGGAPNTNCVLDALSKVSGVTEVRHQEELGSRPMTAQGIQKSDRIQRYFYAYDGLQNNFYFLTRYDGELFLHHGFGCLNCTPRQQDVDKIHPIIIMIEESLVATCNLERLRIEHESCTGVRCNGT